MKSFIVTLSLVFATTALLGTTTLFAQTSRLFSVKVSASRSVTTSSSFSRTVDKCAESSESHSTLSITVNLNSSKSIGYNYDDDFQYQLHPSDTTGGSLTMSGGGLAQYSVSSDERGCDGQTHDEGSGSAQLDLDQTQISVNFTPSTKKGDFSVQAAFLEPTAVGKETSTKSPTINTNDLVKSICKMSFATDGQMSASTEKRDLPAELLKFMEGTGNGGTCSVVETLEGYEVSYNNSATSTDTREGWKGTSTTTITTSVHISLGGKPLIYDAILVPFGSAPNTTSDYKSWVPEGPTPSRAHGNGLAYTVRVVNKDDPSQVLPSDAYSVKAELNEVSHHPGVCTNWPLDDNSKNDDLQFDSLMRDFAHLANFSLSKVQSKEDGGDMPIIVRSYDGAAYGKLTVTATLKSSGISIEAHQENDNKTVIPMPLDKNNNHIADYWEDTVGVLANNYPENWDGEHFNSNEHDGDGLTLFEEYRGFIVQDQFIRLSPKEKDIFVIDQDKIGLQPHFAFFERATAASGGKIKVHVCKPSELHQIVNSVSTEGKGGDQYAIIAKYYSPDDSAELGYLHVIAKPQKDRTKIIDNTAMNPKEAEYLGISKIANLQSALLDYTLAHELAHGLGVHHHGTKQGDNMTRGQFKAYYLDHPDYLLVDQGGKPVDKDTLHLPDRIDFAFANSPASGDEGCIMTYNNFYDFAVNSTKSYNKKHVITVLVKHPEDGSSFCTLPIGTGFNDPAHEPVPVFGNAEKPYGNCWGMFTIKTW